MESNDKEDLDDEPRKECVENGMVLSHSSELYFFRLQDFRRGLCFAIHTLDCFLETVEERRRGREREYSEDQEAIQ